MSLEITTLVILTLLSAFFSCSEVAFFSLPSARIKKYRTDPSLQKRRLSELLSDSRSLLVTIFMLNTIVNVLVQNVSSDLFDSPTGGWALKVGLPLVILLLFGEFIPKYLGMVSSTFFSQIATVPFWYIQKVLSPFRALTLTITEFFSYPFIRLFSDSPKPALPEIEELLATFGEEGILTKREAELLQSFVEIDQKQVKEVATPRSSMKVAPKLSLQSDHAIHKLLETPSSVVIVDHDIDKPIGYLTHDELRYLLCLPVAQREEEISPILFVPEMMTIGALSFKMVLEGYEMACVVDEYGSVVGGIEKSTLLDLLFGSQTNLSQNPHIFKYDNKSLEASGRVPLDVINELFNVQLTSAYHQITLNGWIAEQLGKIPHKGSVVHAEGLDIRILDSSPRAVLRVDIRLSKKIKKSIDMQTGEKQYG